MKITEKKAFRIIRNILIGIIGFIAVVVVAARIYFRAPVQSYYKISDKAFSFPGLGEGYIAQGLSYDKATDNFFLTGYMADHSASPIYIVNRASKKVVNSIRMANSDGSDFTGHAGGLSVCGEKIYVAGSEDCCLYVFDKASIEKAQKNSYVKYIDVVPLNNNSDGIGVAFTTVHDGLIYAGEFYKDVVYPTSEDHYVSCADGTNKALAVGFSVEGNTAIPEVAYSIPNEIQGMCFGPDGIYLTRSWGASTSNIYKFDYDALIQKGTKKVLDKEVPLYILDSSNMAQNYKAPPMAEEIEFVDGRYYISNESASKKYIFGKFTGGRWCYSTEY